MGAGFDGSWKRVDTPARRDSALLSRGGGTSVGTVPPERSRRNLENGVVVMGSSLQQIQPRVSVSSVQHLCTTETMMQSVTSDGLGWGMVFIQDVQKIMELTKTRELRLRDSAVFFALISQADWKTGQIHVSQRELAEMTNQKPADICATLKRFSQHHMVRRIKVDRGVGWYYAINPYVVGFGKERERGNLWAKFQEA